MRMGILFLVLAFLAVTLVASVLVVNRLLDGVQKSEFDSIIGDSKFNIVRWEIKIWGEEIRDFLIFWDKDEKRTEEERVQLVLHYFELIERENQLISQQERNPNDISLLQEIEKIRNEKDDLTDDVEKILGEQIKSVFIEEGVYNPWDKTHIFFPPIKFRLEGSPKVLVVSYREEIKIKERILIKPDISLEEMERIESEIESLGFSAIIVPSSGIASYPSMVVPTTLERTIEIIAHEWTHQYLAFKPLGFNYFKWSVIGKGYQDKVISLNETVAGLVGKEIADKVWEKYYAPSTPQQDSGQAGSGQVPPPTPTPQGGIDFDAEMRKIRKTMEECLARGEVEKAEAYLEEKREWLEENGYFIRKLNQAYFAFYGFYGTSPAHQDAHGGIGEKVMELRDQSPSLKGFLQKIANITTREELEELLGK